MAEEPDRIKDDIETTRSELVRDVDALADRTLPNRVVRRRWEGMKEKMHMVSDKVMGTPSTMAESVGDKARSVAGTVGDTASRAGHKAEEMASDVADAAREAPHMVARQTQGNPIAAGIIAFGVGLLAASLVPTTELERRAGQQLRENASDLVEPIREPLAESAQQLKQDVAETVGGAAEEIKQTAKEAVRTTSEETKSAAQHATDRM